MLRSNLVTSRRLRVCSFGFVAVTAAITFTTDIAEARRYRHYQHHVRHHQSHSEDRDSYSPSFSQIIVDANSGATLTSRGLAGSLTATPTTCNGAPARACRSADCSVSSRYT